MNKSHMSKNPVLLGLFPAMPRCSCSPQARFYNPKVPMQGLEHQLTVLRLLLGPQCPVAGGMAIPPREGVQEVAVLGGAVVFVVLVPTAHAGQGGGSLPPAPPVG